MPFLRVFIPLPHVFTKKLADHHTIKYNFTEAAPSNTVSLDLQERLGVGHVREFTADVHTMSIFPDQDACGIRLLFNPNSGGTLVGVMVTDEDKYYPLQLDTPGLVASGDRGKVFDCTLTWPVGSKEVLVFFEAGSKGQIDSTANDNGFIGYRNLYMRENTALLDTDEAILESFNIWPEQLFATCYGGNNAGFYSPGSSDHIQTYTENGTFASSTSDQEWNRAYRISTAVNSYFDLTFDISGNYGQFEIGCRKGNVNGFELSLFLESGATGTETYLTDKASLDETSATLVAERFYDHPTLFSGYLPTGTYTVRVKMTNGTQWIFPYIKISDTQHLDESLNVVSEQPNDFMSVNHPIRVRRLNAQKDGIAEPLPAWLERQGFREGNMSEDHIGQIINNQQLVTPTYVDYSDTANFKLRREFFARAITSGGDDVEYQALFIGRSYCSQELLRNTSIATVQDVIDGVNASATHGSNQQTKNGSACANDRECSTPIFQKKYSEPFSATPGFTNIIPVNDTKGVRIGQTILIKRDGETVKRRVDSKVADTSVTIDRAVSNLITDFIPANNAEIDFSGYHVVKHSPTAAGTYQFCGYWYTPMTITRARRLPITVSKKAERARLVVSSVTNGQDLPRPIFPSDGRAATDQEINVSWFGNAAGDYFDMPTGLKNVTAVGSPRVIITATRSF